MKDPRKHVGLTFHGVTLELFRDARVTRPRIRPLDTFPTKMLVEFPRALREKNSIGTRFTATVKVCQKHWNHSGKDKGPPYLRASDVKRIDGSAPACRLFARRTPGARSGRSYAYRWEKVRGSRGKV
jgi:hypothetical protein